MGALLCNSAFPNRSSSLKDVVCRGAAEFGHQTAIKRDKEEMMSGFNPILVAKDNPFCCLAAIMPRANNNCF